MNLRLTRLLATLLPLVLIGCDSRTSEPGPAPSGADRVSAEIGRAIDRGDFLRAGQWESEATILEAPGANDGELANLPPQKEQMCLSEKQLSRADTRLFTGGDLDCTYERFSLEGGRIDAAMNCTSAGVPMRFEMAGEYGPDRYDVRIMQDDGGATEGTTVVRVSARRLGDCVEQRSGA